MSSNEFGIVYETCDTGRTPGKRHSADDRDMGIAVFDSFESRDEAVDWLTYLGYRYFTHYRDTQGPGLCWARHCGPQIRPSRRDRLPSVMRARRDQRERDAFQRSLFRNPSYDLVNDPIIEDPYA